MSKTLRDFRCTRCGAQKDRISGLQPVNTTSGKWCQHCWASSRWGKAWADKCERLTEHGRCDRPIYSDEEGYYGGEPNTEPGVAR